MPRKLGDPSSSALTVVVMADRGIADEEDGSALPRGEAQRDAAPRRVVRGRVAAVEASLQQTPRRFLVATLAGAAALVLLVGLANTLVDPYGVAGTHLFPIKTMSDREIKADLVARLDKAPQIVILGSSRAMKLDPRFVQEHLGRRAFNASVSGAKTPDAWAFVNLIHDRFPKAHPDFIWLLDVNDFASARISPGLRSSPWLRRYFSADVRYRSLLEDSQLQFSWNTLRTSIETARNTASERTIVARARRRWAADGWLKDGPVQIQNAKHPKLPYVENHIRIYLRRYYGTRYRGLDPEAKRYFARTLALFASWGGRGLIVLPPTEPRMLAALRSHGWEDRQRELIAYLTTLERRYAFTLVDMSTVDRYGGSGVDFSDGVHLRTAGMERMMNKVLQETGGAIP
jgi:lysophospholipase L1-like esterase